MALFFSKTFGDDKNLISQMKKALFSTKILSSAEKQGEVFISEHKDFVYEKTEKVDPFSVLKSNYDILLDVNRFVEMIHSGQLEKSLGKTRAPQARPVKLPSSSTRQGHVGTGMRPSQRVVGRIFGAAATSSSQPSSPPMMAFPQKIAVKTATGNWKNHPQLVVGNFIYIQHPYKHEKPMWCRISSIGQHGVSCKELDSDSSHVVRWDHIHDIQVPLGLGNALHEEKEAIVRMIDMGMPVVPEKSFDKKTLLDLEDELRKENIPLASDVIHSGEDSLDDVYKIMKDLMMPIDPVSYTTDTSSDSSELPQHLKTIAEQLKMKGIPLSLEKLAELPKSDILAVLKYHHDNSGE